MSGMDTKVEPNDYQAMEDFHLKWRWTDATWNFLPHLDLAQIQPLLPSKAKELNEYSITLLAGEKLNTEMFPNTSEIIDRDDESAEPVRNWLGERGVASETAIIVSWDSGTAAVTNWGIFCKYWDDFCYALADDVVIWPKDRSWTLFYFHEEVISFGHRAE